MIPLSVLDLSVVTTETKPAAALRNSIDLARHVDALGYVRYWLGGDHNLPPRARPPPRGDVRAYRGRDQPSQGRLRRRDAAEPCAAGGRRALQDAGGAFSRPH